MLQFWISWPFWQLPSSHHYLNFAIVDDGFVNNPAFPGFVHEHETLTRLLPDLGYILTLETKLRSIVVEPVLGLLKT
jgi:hypothetical protein